MVGYGRFLKSSVDAGATEKEEEEESGREDCSVTGAGDEGSPAVTAFNIDHRRCAGVALSESETRNLILQNGTRGQLPLDLRRLWERNVGGTAWQFNRPLVAQKSAKKRLTN